MNIIGLGHAGCQMAKAFSKFPQYNTCGIDTTKEATITIKARGHHEDYDQMFPSLKRRLSLIDGPVYVIVCGAGDISGGILRLLEQLAHRNPSVMYIQPDLPLLSETQKIQERITRNVLQEYARSGKLEMLYLLDNVLLERGIGEVPIMGYFDILNQAVVNTFHMLNIFRHGTPVLGNFIEPSPLARIATLGVMDVDAGTEKWFYDLTEPRDVVYYYGINEEDLRTDGSLFKQITEFVKSKVKEKINVSYGVFQTSYEQKYCYCIKYTSVVQSSLEEK
jgi:hypothetical protein